MSDIARRLTGMTAGQLREYEFPPVFSVKDTFIYPTIRPRSNVRLRDKEGMVGVVDLNDMREKLAKDYKKLFSK